MIATKKDKIKRSQVGKQTALIRRTLGMAPEDILIPFSAETKDGREEIYHLLEAGLQETPAETPAPKEQTEAAQEARGLEEAPQEDDHE